MKELAIAALEALIADIRSGKKAVIRVNVDENATEAELSVSAYKMPPRDRGAK